MSSEYIPQRPLSLHAHPHDREFSLGGTLAKWAKAECEIIFVAVTSGDSGSNDPPQEGSYKKEPAELREQEQLAANAVLGIRETVFLRYPDGELQPTLTLRKDPTRLIRPFKPDAVSTGNPDGWFYGDEYLNHPDHRAAAQAACGTVFPSAGTRLIFPDLLAAGYEPHEVKRSYIHGTDKARYMGGHHRDNGCQNQGITTTRGQADAEEVDKWMRGRRSEEAKDGGMKYAEGHKVMILKNEEEG
jgi:LmbE family N-acetylglucosaminyl deacetylase